mmetsp:Transcript_31234/g.90793  ORF Transcript_31234/g.90793 Transcript_31234/m.90793 type:complete len:388 (-) Transcript_31234:1682-2845(-)
MVSHSASHVPQGLEDVRDEVEGVDSRVVEVLLHHEELDEGRGAPGGDGVPALLVGAGGLEHIDRPEGDRQVVVLDEDARHGVHAGPELVGRLSADGHGREGCEGRVHGPAVRVGEAGDAGAEGAGAAQQPGGVRGGAEGFDEAETRVRALAPSVAATADDLHVALHCGARSAGLTGHGAVGVEVLRSGGWGKVCAGKAAEGQEGREELLVPVGPGVGDDLDDTLDDARDATGDRVHHSLNHGVRAGGEDVEELDGLARDHAVLGREVGCDKVEAPVLGRGDHVLDVGAVVEHVAVGAESLGVHGRTRVTRDLVHGRVRALGKEPHEGSPCHEGLDVLGVVAVPVQEDAGLLPDDWVVGLDHIQEHAHGPRSGHLLEDWFHFVGRPGG